MESTLPKPVTESTTRLVEPFLYHLRFLLTSAVTKAVSTHGHVSGSMSATSLKVGLKVARVTLVDANGTTRGLVGRQTRLALALWQFQDLN